MGSLGLVTTSAPAFGLMQILIPLVILIALGIIVKGKIAKIIVWTIVVIFVLINVAGLFGISLNIFGLNLNGIFSGLIG